MLPPRQQLLNGALLQRHVPLVAPNPNEGAGSPVSDSATETDSSMDTWPASDALTGKVSHKEGVSECGDLSVTRRNSTSEMVSLGDIARGNVDVIKERMERLSFKYLEDLKLQLRVILEGNGGPRQKEAFLTLQKHVQNRNDLTSDNMLRANQVQLEILVSVKTGIQAFLHQGINLSRTSLIDIFFYRRCRNVACHSQLPAADCKCEMCMTKKGFCNLCMCVICNKFDFDVNTCRWIGCDLCSHWTHAECALRGACIGMGSSKAGIGNPVMNFRCLACGKSSELLGWVKDVFVHCAMSWDRESLLGELDCVCKIFCSSEDPKGRKLFWKCEDLYQKIMSGFPEKSAAKAILQFFHELEMETPTISVKQEGGYLVPREACTRIAEVVHEVVGKMEAVAEQKMRMFKKARLAFEACDREVSEKVREVEALEVEKQRKKQQLSELDCIVRLKQAEADMFQLKADEARREAERLQRIVLQKTDKSDDYTSTYLKQRLDEAEAEKQYLLSKLKLQARG